MTSFKRLFLLLLFPVLLLTGCGETITPGYVGILVNNYGDQKGVQDLPIRTGRLTYNSMTQTLYQYPTFLQNVVWCKSSSEGKDADESITFSSKEGSQVNADVALSYALVAEQVPAIFVEYRMDMDHITHVYMRSKVRDAISNAASKMSVKDIYGPGKADLMTNAVKALRDELEPKGFKIDSLSFTSAPRIDDNIQKSIDAVISQNNLSLQAQAKLDQVKAEAEQKVAQAKGEAAAKLESAKGDAASTLARAEAQAKANLELARSLTPDLVKYESLQRWDGKLPEYTSGGNEMPVPYLSLPSMQVK